MNVAVSDFFGAPSSDGAGFTRAVRWSFGIHLAAIVLLVVVPRDWITTERPQDNVMVLELGGSPGPSISGRTAAGNRTVEEITEARRPQPIQPNVSPPDVMTIPQREPVRVQPPPPPRQERQTATTPRPPAAGRELNQGNTAVETGSRGQGEGLSSGGGGGTSAAFDVNFCCPGYIDLLRGQVDQVWNKNLPERGTTILQFTIVRSGAIQDVQVLRSSGSNLLDREAIRAVGRVRLPELPLEWTEPTLGIRLTFPYEN